jgi:ubiquinol-cytochrome c reductase cytochrome c subunit
MERPMTTVPKLAVTLICAMGLIIAFAGMSAARSGPVQAPASSTADAVSNGRTLFLASCATCHGTDGGGTDKAPALIGVGAAAADFELRTGRMPFAGTPGTQAVRKPPAFDDAQIRDLVAYVASLGPGPAIPQPTVSDSLLSQGEQLFIDNCAPCHGAAAKGGAVGGGWLAPPLDQATPVQVAEALLIGPGQMPVFSDFTDTERNAIVTYVEYLRSAPDPGGFSIGGVGPVPEGFVGWLLGFGSLLLIVMLIGRDWHRHVAPELPERGAATRPPGGTDAV